MPMRNNVWNDHPALREAMLPVRGKHAPRDKIFLLLPVTEAVCLLPILLGVRLWERIPEIVITGIVNARGEDDSIPRAVLVFGLPCLAALLNLICHIQLYRHQRAKTFPPGFVSLSGRWGMPILSVFVFSAFMLRAAGAPVEQRFVISCAAGTALLLLGGRILSFTGGGIAAPAADARGAAPGTGTPQPKRLMGKDFFFWAGALYLLLGMGILGAAIGAGKPQPAGSVALAAAAAGPVLFVRRRAAKN